MKVLNNCLTINIDFTVDQWPYGIHTLTRPEKVLDSLKAS